MITLKTHAHDTGSINYWRSYAKSHGRRWGYMQAAKHYAAANGSAVVHHGDDSATVICRETGMTFSRVNARKHSVVRWI